MQHMVRVKTKITKDGKISLKDLPFKPGETVEVTVRGQKRKKKTNEYPLRGKPVTYHQPSESVSEDDWEVLR